MAEVMEGVGERGMRGVGALDGVRETTRKSCAYRRRLVAVPIDEQRMCATQRAPLSSPSAFGSDP